MLHWSIPPVFMYAKSNEAEDKLIMQYLEEVFADVYGDIQRGKIGTASAKKIMRDQTDAVQRAAQNLNGIKNKKAPPKQSFSIETLDNGEKITVINIDQNVFYNKPLYEFPKIARKVIMNKFKDAILPLSDNDLAKIGKRSWEEYAYPRTRLDTASIEFEAKMRAATELDNLLETAEFSHWEENKK